MPWKEINVMDERLKMVSHWIGGAYTVTELSSIYGVSRKTIYKWIGRYGEFGVDGLSERERRPHAHPNRTDEAIIGRLIRLKREHMNWGPKKLLAILRRREPGTNWPSLSTAEKWLKQNGLVKKRVYRRHTPPYTEPFVDCNMPNDVWSADYKGQFRTMDTRWCYPLTISDNMSRYLLTASGLLSPCYIDTQQLFEQTFREYGIPWAIRSDNGTPFAGSGRTGLSRLSIWWIKLGIRPERIELGKPQQNGRHERMHRTLKADTANPPGASLRAQQRRFDKFVREYNEERPHEALGQRPPADFYKRAGRRYPEKIRGPQYDEGVRVRRVRSSGEIKFEGSMYYLTELLSGERVGFRTVGDGYIEIRFGFHPIGYIDLHLGIITGMKPEKV